MATSNEAVQAQNASDHTMYVAVEVSRKSWTVALHARNTGRIGIHTLPAADTAALAGLVDRARDALEREHGAPPRVLCGYEAGYEGFWLARRLAPLGIEPLVLDPASLPASRKARRAKSGAAPPLRRPIGRRRSRWTPRCRSVRKALSPRREPPDRAALAIEAEADPAEWYRRSRSRMVYRMEEGVAFLPQGRAGVWPNASRAETRRLMDRVPPCGTSRP